MIRLLACALLLLASPDCRAPLTFVRSAASADWNQTLPTDDPVDNLSLVLHVTSTHVPAACNGTVRRGVAVGVHYIGRIANDSLAGQPGAAFATG